MSTSGVRCLDDYFTFFRAWDDQRGVFVGMVVNDFSVKGETSRASLNLVGALLFDTWKVSVVLKVMQECIIFVQRGRSFGRMGYCENRSAERIGFGVCCSLDVRDGEVIAL